MMMSKVKISTTFFFLIATLSSFAYENEGIRICYRANDYWNNFFYRTLDSQISIYSLSCNESSSSELHDTQISIPVISEYEEKGYSVIAHYSNPNTQTAGLIFVQDKKIYNIPEDRRPLMYFYEIEGQYRCKGRYELRIPQNSSHEMLIWYYDGSVDQYKCNRVGEINVVKNQPWSSV